MLFSKSRLKTPKKALWGKKRESHFFVVSIYQAMFPEMTVCVEADEKAGVHAYHHNILRENGVISPKHYNGITNIFLSIYLCTRCPTKNVL